MTRREDDIPGLERTPACSALAIGQTAMVIKAIEVKVDAIAQKPGRGRRKMKSLEFYRATLGEFNCFKDAFRNAVMHTRASYNHYHAERIINNVENFMQRLAANDVSDKMKKSAKRNRKI